MKPRALTIALLTMSVCSLSVPLAAQSTSARDPNPALWQSTPDATALGSGGGAFLSYGVDKLNNDWLLSAGLGLFGGLLHASYGRGSVVGSPVQEYALGYARSLERWDIGPWMSWGAGVDLTVASQRSAFSLNQSQAVRLMVPFSFRLGSPSSVSVSPYAGPYAEYGRAQLLECGASSGICSGAVIAPGSTHSTGLAFGADITEWRLGFTLGALGVPDGIRAFRPGWQGTAAFRIRF